MCTVSCVSLAGLVILCVCGVPTVESVYSLPGIFSSAHCQNADDRKLLEPACSCMERAKVDDINGLCSSSNRLISCIAEELSKGSNSNSYMQTIFSASHMERSLQYVCKFWKAGSAESLSCGEAAADCETEFMVRLRNTTGHMFTNQSCRMTDLLGRCYWGTLHACPARVRHILHQLVDGHITYNCSREGKSKTGKCVYTTAALYPEQNSNKAECLKAVDTSTACLVRERAYSLHPRDIWYKLDFELGRLRLYQRYMCHIQNRPDMGKCSLSSHLINKVKKCVKTYETEYEKQVNELYDNVVVTIGDVCRIINTYTSCLSQVYASCPTDNEYYQAMFCASMPSACHCSVSQSKAQSHTGGSSAASIVLTPLAGIWLALGYIVVYSLFC